MRRDPQGATASANSSIGPLVLAWAFVGIPLAWGIYRTLLSAIKLFQ